MKQQFGVKSAVMTCGVNALIDEGAITMKDVQVMMFRHVHNNDDNKYAEDREYNQEAIDGNFGRVLSVYEVKGYRFYVNTYMGQSEEPTCVMLTDEY